MAIGALKIRVGVIWLGMMYMGAALANTVTGRSEKGFSITLGIGAVRGPTPHLSDYIPQITAFLLYITKASASHK